jgi:hypothetical protein
MTGAAPSWAARRETAMLGDLLYEETGQVTGTRVLPADDGAPRVETSFHATGTMRGTHHEDTSTYAAVARPDGTVFGEGQGLLVTEHGDIATWTGQGTGRILEDGRTVFRGAVYLRTGAERLAWLNGACGVFEYEVDAGGKTQGKIWEWK